MEQAIYISKIAKIKLWNAKYTRIYFGNEFCERLIPDTNELKEVLNFVLDRELDFSLVTCYVTDKGLNKFEELFEILSTINSTFEVIINDWGLLKVSRKYLFRPVLGRLLTKQKRDPRILNIIDKLPKITKEHFKDGCFNNEFIEFLKGQKIERIELDNLLQGIWLNRMESMVLSFSLYLPFGYISTSRFCFSNLYNRKGDKIVGIFSCNKECQQNRSYILNNPRIPRSLLIKGNTIFFENKNVQILNNKTRINRIVYEPELPF